MKTKYKALYEAARAALEKIAGKDLYQYVDVEQERNKEKMLADLTERLNILYAQTVLNATQPTETPAPQPVQQPTAQTASKSAAKSEKAPIKVAKEQAEQTPVMQFALKTLGTHPLLSQIEAQGNVKSKKEGSEEESPQIDYQASLRCIQAIASITLGMLTGMEVKK